MTSLHVRPRPVGPIIGASIVLPSSVRRIITAAMDAAADFETLLVVNRVAPTATQINLGPVANRGGVVLEVADISNGIVAEHSIALVAHGSDKINLQGTWTLVSTPASLASIRLMPVPELGAWTIVA